MNYLGMYNHTLDAKNRIFIPSRYRECLGGTFVVCKAPAPDKCIYVYSQDDWEVVAAQVKSLPGDESNRRFKRTFFSAADNVEMDKQGRFTIKSDLIEYAGLKKDVIIVGVGNKFEIWDAENYENDSYTAANSDYNNIEVVF